ncbi:hypothetical protein GQ42DRAFT_162628, partial [Ramicandelaber brevisporus]
MRDRRIVWTDWILRVTPSVTFPSHFPSCFCRCTSAGAFLPPFCRLSAAFLLHFWCISTALLLAGIPSRLPTSNRGDC